MISPDRGDARLRQGDTETFERFRDNRRDPDPLRRPRCPRLWVPVLRDVREPGREPTHDGEYGSSDRDDTISGACHAGTDTGAQTALTALLTTSPHPGRPRFGGGFSVHRATCGRINCRERTDLPTSIGLKTFDRRAMPASYSTNILPPRMPGLATPARPSSLPNPKASGPGASRVLC